MNGFSLQFTCNQKSSADSVNEEVKTEESFFLTCFVSLQLKVKGMVELGLTKDFFYLLSFPFYLLSGPFYLLSGPFYLFFFPFYLLSGPFYLLSGPFRFY